MSSQPYAESWLTGPSSTQFYTRTYTPSLDSDSQKPKAVVVFVHGFAVHIGRYVHIHPLLAARGIAVFTYDQRGFGLTALDASGKSPTSTYGKTSWKDQMADIDWALECARKTFKDVPLFLMGHSMGGTEVLGYPTQGQNGAHRSMLDSLSGIISTSPLILQTTPMPKTAKWLIGILGALLPYAVIPAPGKLADLSHDPEVSSTYLNDPLLKQTGTLKGLSDLISQGERLLHSDYINWPKTLPVTSHTASQSFHDKLPAQSKKIHLFKLCPLIPAHPPHYPNSRPTLLLLHIIQGGFHELHNERDGVKEKLVDEVVAFIEEHLHNEADRL